ncbi:MAG: PQQ-dependent dehydrogenase, methanol/ethanol family [Steroidobacteraceae bacterium]
MNFPNWRRVLAPAAIFLAVGIACAAVSVAQAQEPQSPDLWASMGQNYALDRHSPLTQINPSNAHELEMIWAQSTGALRGHEGQPIVVDVDGTPMMFFESAWPNIVQALDLSDPDHPVEVWNYVKKTDRDLSAVPRACCDTVNRGLNYADGKVVLNTLDGYLIALDAKTGKVDWEVKRAYPDKGETVTNAPLIADGKVIAGFGGDEFGARGRVDAYDLSDGKLAWSYYSNGTDAEIGLTPETNKANPQYGTYGHDTGLTYPGDEWKRGGGAAWAWYSYDPQLRLVYYGTGNPGLWSPSYRCGANPPTQEACNAGKYDNKWSMSIFARNVDTGKVVWVYQMTPFDQWDYDGVNEPILVNLKIHGRERKVLVHFDRNGFAYVLDRTNGDLLEAHKYVAVNWAEKIDMKTGRPVKVYEHSPLLVGQMAQACPSAMGGKDQQPASVDPNNPAIFYVPTNNWCMQDTPQTRTSMQQGVVYVFANVYMYEHVPGVAGRLKAFNVVTGQTVWNVPDKYPNWGGTMNTAGGVVFYGSLGGDFRAVDAKTGRILWSRKLGSGIIGNPISYEIKGHQYVSVFAGIGGWIGLPITAGLDLSDKYGAIGATAMAKATHLNEIPQGGTLYTFRLPGREQVASN